MEIKKTTLYFWGTLMIIVFGGYLMMAGSGNSITGNAVAGGSGETQEVVIGMKNYNYNPGKVTVNVNQPVRISLDSTVQGCFRDFTIRDLGIQKYLQTPNDYVEFTPTKKGTYTFACSMGMGYGKLVVK